MTDELLNHDALALGELLRRGDITPQELIDITVRRIDYVNPILNAVIYRTADPARHLADQQPLGYPFSGAPFLLKDMFAEYQGMPFQEGSRAVTGYISKIDTELVKRYKTAGLLIVGKTNTPEFAGLPTTEPRLHGATVNPWNPDLSPGGSSGGAAAAVA